MRARRNSCRQARRRLCAGADGSRRHGLHAAQSALRHLPVHGDCQAQATGLAEELPRRAPKADKPTRRGLAFVLSRKDGAVLLRKRRPRVAGGMDEVPSSDWREASSRWPRR